ncbi:hypothetical protein DFH06DRAFT_1088697 [Mycena polygramma]|nr:hypothetical protein DFH06DRAFT_331707 [Mycena polygramma]KAJ7662188.1 hypothetical protein DFH06DRAFT_1088697 [Mycena polygramma]
MSRQILATCTQHAALASARSDSDCDQVVDNLKQEWVYAWGWLMLLLTLDIALFTIGSPSLFTVDAFGQKVINASGVATIFGLLCDGWFYVRYHHLQTKAFLTRARDIYNGYAFFALSARLPSLGALLSLSALLMFVGRTAFKRAPVLVVVLIALFFVLLGLQFIVRGTEVVYCSVSGALSAVVGWAQRGREKIAALVENRNALQPPSLAETGRPEV